MLFLQSHCNGRSRRTEVWLLLCKNVPLVLQEPHSCTTLTLALPLIKFFGMLSPPVGACW